MPVELFDFDQRIEHALYYIRDSAIEPISYTAQLFLKDKEKQQAVVLPPTNPLLRGHIVPSTPTGVVLLATKEASTIPYRMFIVANEQFVLDGLTTTENLAGHLVRDLAVWGRFPSNGYQHRLRTTIETAAGIQTEFLTALRIPDLNTKVNRFIKKDTIQPQDVLQLDPRHSKDEESYYRTVMGTIQYFADTGFHDWQQVIDQLMVDTNFLKQVPVLDDLATATNKFVTLREMYRHSFYDDANHRTDWEFSETWDADHRAKSFASFLIDCAFRSN